MPKTSVFLGISVGRGIDLIYNTSMSYVKKVSEIELIPRPGMSREVLQMI